MKDLTYFQKLISNAIGKDVIVSSVHMRTDVMGVDVVLENSNVYTIYPGGAHSYNIALPDGTEILVESRVF